MKKLLNQLFPILDYLYIFQILEYKTSDYIKWFIKNPFKRGLQKKHKLVFSSKIKALFIGTILGQILATVMLTNYFGLSYPGFLFFLILAQLVCPIFIIITGLIYQPLENYLKESILQKASQKLARLPNLKIVAITGSFGKTSTKEILYTLLWKKFYVVKTPKSFNTPLGIAQTILEDVKGNTQILIAEAGAYKIGEIAKIAKLIKPDIGIITAIAPQHLERFGSIENIAKAKFELVENLKESGRAILNGQYPIIRDLACNLRGCIVELYGQTTDPYYATDIKPTVNGTDLLLHTPFGNVKIHLPLIGEHHVQNFLAAAAAAHELGLTLTEIAEQAKWLLPTPHRLEIRKEGPLTIIDNSFNTNPKSARSSLQLLKSYTSAQKIIITPGLVELGKESAKENADFARDASRVADEFVIVGEYAKKYLLDGLASVSFPKDKIHLAKSTSAGIKLLSSLAKDEAAVLLENDLPDQYN
jgi:UDP-N-acetylmuramoyl-tripeptide--D-alanyl-D-alanine ligase